MATSLIAEKTELTVHQMDPLGDSRWERLVQDHPNATIFHTRGWLEALHRTYGYEPLVLTTSAEGETLGNVLVLCKVSSWLTGPRWVSLPFSDHCQPLVDDPRGLVAILKYLEAQVDGRHCKYVELRPLTDLDPEVEAASKPAFSDIFCIHMLDLRPPVDSLFKNFHKSCVQRKLQRAQREELTIEVGQSQELLNHFYQLMIKTRRRHKIPPQPLSWFRNLLDCLGDNARVHVAFKGSTPIASIFTLTHKNTFVYKYGCSDASYHNLGGTLSLFWHAIQAAKQMGFERFDFGRSEAHDQGLVSFKDHWGGVRTRLRYYRYPWHPPLTHSKTSTDRQTQIAEQVFSRLPDFCLVLAGKLLYRHIG